MGRRKDIPNLPQYSPDKLQAVCLELGIRMLIVFGSRAQADRMLKPESDLDLGVLFHPGFDRLKFGLCFDRFADVFPGYSLDLGFMNQADPLFRFEVVRDGILLYGEEMDYLEYKAFAFRDFIDSRDLRELEARLFEQRMSFIQAELNKAGDRADGPA